MATTLETLEQRLAALEAEVERLRGLIEPPGARAMWDGREVPILQRARAAQPAISAAVAKAFAAMGITGKAIGAEKLQEMMIASGIRPEDNAASREIIAMREE